MTLQSWPGKLLLFGEYTLLMGGQAFAMPLFDWSGHWIEHGQSQDNSLLTWAAWLTLQEKENRLPWEINIPAFHEFVQKGGHFSSSIPQGVGMGSSGALVAAFAERWSVSLPDHLPTLQAGLGKIEGFFHGNSSGLDPLISLIGKPMLIGKDHLLELVNPPVLPSGLFLLDSGLSRKTGPLVAGFKKSTEDVSFSTVLESEYMPLVEQAIDALHFGPKPQFLKAFQHLSEAQFTFFRDMIPEQIRPLWQGKHHCLKLCGAGGGGFFLGYAPDPILVDLPGSIHWLS